MEIFPSVETKAGRIPDGIQRLQYLRRKHVRKRSSRAQSFFVLAVASGACVLVFLGGSPRQRLEAKLSAPQPTGIIKHPADLPENVWAVEQHGASVVYSNGLQVRNDYLTSSTPRQYRLLRRETFEPSALQQKPAGIVYHTTESLLLPLEASRNRSLIDTREDLLEHVRRERLYNFVIDRFGQVFRIVPENQTAFHAGHSIWASSQWIYDGLNQSFLGVSFEARSQDFAPSDAQVRSGRMLTEMLRATYQIPEVNCVTHAQVSVNPDNMRIGYHTDWAANFPFHQLGLTPGYDATVAAVEVFGFRYDDRFLQAIGGHPWEGLVRAEEQILRVAQSRGMTPETYRESLQQQFHLRRNRQYENPATGQ